MESLRDVGSTESMARMEQQQVMRQILRQQHQDSRKAFIASLLEEMETMKFGTRNKKSGKTLRSQYYSTRVAQWDKANKETYENA